MCGGGGLRSSISAVLETARELDGSQMSEDGFVVCVCVCARDLKGRLKENSELHLAPFCGQTEQTFVFICSGSQEQRDAG